MWKDRTALLVGDEGLEKLTKSHVAVIGLGGVGGYVAMLLARAGVGKITIVDFDTVDETNINRQIVADIETVGQLKTEVMYKMIQKVNPECVVRVLAERIDKNTVEKVFSVDCDYVVDAIDSVNDKVELISFCKAKGLKIISAMGAGNRVCVPNFVVTDIYKTQNDGLAKIMRKKLRDVGVESLEVATTLEKAIKNTETNTIGSISYYPAMCGCVIAGHVITRLLGV